MTVYFCILSNSQCHKFKLSFVNLLRVLFSTLKKIFKIAVKTHHCDCKHKIRRHGQRDHASSSPVHIDNSTNVPNNIIAKSSKPQLEKKESSSQLSSKNKTYNRQRFQMISTHWSKVLL